jgi:hypothetical protein
LKTSSVSSQSQFSKVQQDPVQQYGAVPAPLRPALPHVLPFLLPEAIQDLPQQKTAVPAVSQSPAAAPAAPTSAAPAISPQPKNL